MEMFPIALTIAGSDPSGGAGIQADLKTFASLKVYGMSVITALTAQNTVRVSGVMEVSAEFVGRQLDAVMSDIPPAAVKTGMLASAGIVEVVTEKIEKYQIGRLIVDPVMVSSSGTPLLDAAGVETLRRRLLPMALLVSPNLAEATMLTGIEVTDTATMEEAARLLQAMGPRNVLVKGGHLGGDAVDVFYDGRTVRRLSSPRVNTKDLHGTGCVLSAAMTAYLAQGLSVVDAVDRGKKFVTEAIRASLRLGHGAGPVNPLWS